MASITGSSYTVQSGDNLWSIVRKASPGLSNAEIAKRVNQIIEDNPDQAKAINERRLSVGAKLDISGAFGEKAPEEQQTTQTTDGQLPVMNFPADSAINNMNGATTGNPILDAIFADALGLNDPNRPNNRGTFSELLINGGDPNFGTDLGLANRTFGEIANNLSGVGLIPAFNPEVILNNVFGNP